VTSTVTVPSTSTVSVLAYGTISSGTIPTSAGDPAAGILAGYNPNSSDTIDANVAGNVSIDDYATITAAAGTDGIRGFNYGIGSVTILTETGATITGGRYGIGGFTYDGGNVSITNNASVTGTTAAIDASATSGGTVSIDNFGTINGAIVSDTTTTFQNEAGAIWNASSNSTFTGPSFTNQGTINVTNGAALTISATNYTDTGTLTANGGNITITVAETGAGSATIYGTSQIQYDGASSENVTFATGATGELVLLDSAAFTGTITGFTGTGAGPTTSDKLDLNDINFSSPLFSKSYSNNVLTVSDGTHTATIKFAGTYTLAIFSFATDGSIQNGTLVTDPPVISGQSDAAASGTDISKTTTINDGAVLELGAPSTDKITFSDSTGTLVLDQPASFQGQIAGISGLGDIINLKGFDANHTTATAKFNPINDTTVLSVTDASDHQSASLTLDGNYASFVFRVTADANSGADVAGTMPAAIADKQTPFIVTNAGTSGNDVIFATGGSDVLTGGGGQDQFVFKPTTGSTSVQHTITDFNAAIDTIDLRQFPAISASTLPSEVQVGNDTLVTLDSHDTLLLKNVAASSLHASDFIVHS
jgi:large repetitive protein